MVARPYTWLFREGSYTYLTTSDVHSERGRFEDVWQKQVPLKVSVFAWRLLRNRIPTKDNLFRRRIIPFDDTSCIVGYGSSETADHLLFHCAHFGMVWHRIYQWLGISFIAPAVNRYHQTELIPQASNSNKHLTEV